MHRLALLVAISSPGNVVRRVVRRLGSRRAIITPLPGSSLASSRAVVQRPGSTAATVKIKAATAADMAVVAMEAVDTMPAHLAALAVLRHGSVEAVASLVVTAMVVGMVVAVVITVTVVVVDLLPGSNSRAMALLAWTSMALLHRLRLRATTSRHHRHRLRTTSRRRLRRSKCWT